MALSTKTSGERIRLWGWDVTAWPLLACTVYSYLRIASLNENSIPCFSFHTIYLWASRYRKENGSLKIGRPSSCESSCNSLRPCNMSREQLQRRGWESYMWTPTPVQAALLVSTAIRPPFGLPARRNKWTRVAQFSCIPNNVVCRYGVFDNLYAAYCTIVYTLCILYAWNIYCYSFSCISAFLPIFFFTRRCK